jgi:adenylosuccinate lyase
MPQKRNPKLSQDIIAAAAQIRALVPLALEAMQTEHEADRTTSIMMSRALVQACELTGDVLQRMIALFEGLQVFPERMRRNLDLSGGLIMAEALMLDLGRHIGRQRAHDAVYDAAQGAVTESRPFREMLAADPQVSARLTPAQVEALLDPARYTGLCREFAERGAARAREVAAALRRRPDGSTAAGPTPARRGGSGGS